MVLEKDQLGMRLQPPLKKKGLRRGKDDAVWYLFRLQPPLKKKGLRRLTLAIGLSLVAAAAPEEKGIKTRQQPGEECIPGLQPPLKKKGLRPPAHYLRSAWLRLQPPLKKKGLRRRTRS